MTRMVVGTSFLNRYSNGSHEFTGCGLLHTVSAGVMSFSHELFPGGEGVLQQWFENFRDLADLEAQIASAYWTRIAAIVSLASIVVSVGALVGLLRSLNQTSVALKEAKTGREEARIASEAALAQAAEANKLARLERRPWLSVKILRADGELEYRPHDSESYAVTPLTIQISNHGAQPAVFCDITQPVAGIEKFDFSQCGTWQNFEEFPLKEVIFPQQIVEKTIMFQTPLSVIESANVGKVYGSVDLIAMSGGLHIGVAYVDTDQQQNKAATTVLIRWQTFVPATVFRDDASWKHNFSVVTVANSAT